MVDNEKIKSILTLYKQSKISEYVLERELGEYFGDLVRVQIEKESTTGKVSYCIFAIPELKQEGLRLTFVMDSNALKNIYKEDEFVVVCERMKDKIQNYTFGIIIYAVGKKIKYMHSIFHLFTLAASICFFFSIFFYVI